MKTTFDQSPCSTTWFLIRTMVLSPYLVRRFLLKSSEAPCRHGFSPTSSPLLLFILWGLMGSLTSCCLFPPSFSLLGFCLALNFIYVLQLLSCVDLTENLPPKVQDQSSSCLCTSTHICIYQAFPVPS